MTETPYSPSEISSTARLERLIEISYELNSTADRDVLLQVIMDAATELTGAETASVMLLDPHTRELYFAAASKSSQPGIIGMKVPLENSIGGAILLHEEPMIVSDVRQDPRYYAKVGQTLDYETRSLLGVPMLAEGRKVGVLEAINKVDGEFNQEDVDTLSTLATLAAIAIRKAALISELQDANEQLNQLDRLKSNFIAIASHELRTPLAIILGYIALLREDVGGREVEGVLTAAVRLRNVMEDMFNLQYIDAGQSQLELSRFCLADRVGEIVEERDSMAEAKEQTVEFHRPEAEMPVLADKESLRLVMNNLISNAVKFTPTGGKITLTVSERPREVWVSVADSGAGIPEEAQPRVFDRFFQAEDHMIRHHAGLGLGLALAKELLEMQDGRIWFESTEGEGSTFTFALPLALNES